MTLQYASERFITCAAANNPNPICVENADRVCLIVSSGTGTRLTTDRSNTGTTRGLGPDSTGTLQKWHLSVDSHFELVKKAWFVNVTGVGVVVTIFEVVKGRNLSLD